MKILFIEGDIVNALSGLRSHLVRRLKMEGHEVYISGGIPYRTSFELSSDEFDRRNGYIRPLGNLSNSVKDILKAFLSVVIFAIQSKPNFCFVYNIKPLILWGVVNRFFNVPSVCTITGTVTYRKGLDINWKYKGIIAFALKSYKIVVFQNDFDKDLFKSILRSNQDILIIPGSGVDIDHFVPKKYDKTVIDFLFVGRLLKEKGIMEYLEASSRCKTQFPDLKFGLLGPIYTNSIVGSSISLDIIKWYGEKYGLQYFGESKDVDRFIAKTECLVLPSYGEGISNVLLEAGSMEKPLITTNVPGCREIVENGKNGFICDVKSIHSLKNVMEKFLNLSINQRKEMGEYSRRKIAKEFSKDSIVEKYLNLIHKV